MPSGLRGVLNALWRQGTPWFVGGRPVYPSALRSLLESKSLSSWRIDEKYTLYAVACHIWATIARPGRPAPGGT
jgi:hypothetical protein